jgi:hypothetical protein
MSKALAAAAFAALLLTAGSAAAQQRQLDKETSIAFAANGGLRNWQGGPPGSNIVYVQDRTLRWYKVTLTGPCIDKRRFEAMQYRTGPDGRFDRFSQVWSTHFPQARCGVTSIRTSLAPKGQPGYRPARNRG